MVEARKPRRRQVVLREELVADQLRLLDADLGEIGIGFQRGRIIRIQEVDGLRVGHEEALDLVRLARERVEPGEVHAHRLVLEGFEIALARHDADASRFDVVDDVGRGGPADIDLAGHGLREGRRRRASGDRLDVDARLLDERQRAKVGRRAVRRIGHRLAGGVLQRFDRRIGGHIPEDVVRAGHLAGEGANRRALGEGRHDAAGARADADVNAAGNHRLRRLARAGGIKHLQLEAVLGEYAGPLTNVRDGRVPGAALRHGELQQIFGPRRLRAEHGQRRGRQNEHRFHLVSSNGHLAGYVVPPSSVEHHSIWMPSSFTASPHRSCSLATNA